MAWARSHASKQWIGQFVISQHIQAVDLADGELLYPMSNFVKPILKARDAGLKVTIHSGEDTPASAVWDTIHAFQPDRIGHGIHSIEDMKVVELIKERRYYP